jgi:hypothetical protein
MRWETKYVLWWFDCRYSAKAVITKVVKTAFKIYEIDRKTRRQNKIPPFRRQRCWCIKHKIKKYIQVRNYIIMKKLKYIKIPSTRIIGSHWKNVHHNAPFVQQSSTNQWVRRYFAWALLALRPETCGNIAEEKLS